MILAVTAFGWLYFTNAFNNLDFAIVVISVIDFIVSKTIGGSSGGVAVVRVIRLFRIFRIVRVFTVFNQAPRIIQRTHRSTPERSRNRK